MEQCRAQALNPGTTADLYMMADKLIVKYEIEVKDLYNMDEKSCQQGVGDKVHILVDQNQKNVQQVKDGN